MDINIQNIHTAADEVETTLETQASNIASLEQQNSALQEKVDSSDKTIQDLNAKLALVTANDQSLAAKLLAAQAKIASQRTFFNIKSQLPPGTKLLANGQGWFNGADGSKHIANVCQSDDPRTVHNQALAYHAVGITDYVQDWYGPQAADFAQPTDKATQLWGAEAAALGMGISIMLDSGAFKWSRTDFSKLLASDILYIRQKYISLPNYTHIGGKPVIWEFGWAEHGIDIAAIAKANPDLTILTQSRMAGGAGTYGWVNGFAPSTPQAYMQNYLAQNHPIQIPCIFDGFDDHDPANPANSRWGGPARKIPYGQWQMCIDEINKAAAAGKKFEGVQLVTVGDHDERTEMESKFLALAGLKLF
jgi:hypothetical protein